MKDYLQTMREQGIQQQQQVVDQGAEFISNVKEVQKKLIEAGYLAQGLDTGTFGDKTKQALKGFIADNSVKTDLEPSATATLELFKELDKMTGKVDDKFKSEFNQKTKDYQAKLQEIDDKNQQAAQEAAKKAAEEAEAKRRADDEKNRTDGQKSAFEVFVQFLVKLFNGTLFNGEKSENVYGGRNAMTETNKRDFADYYSKNPQNLAEDITKSIDNYSRTHTYDEFKNLPKNGYKGLKFRFEDDKGNSVETDFSKLSPELKKQVDVAFNDLAARFPDQRSYDSEFRPLAKGGNQPKLQTSKFDELVNNPGLSENERTVFANMKREFDTASDTQKSQIVKLLQSPNSTLNKFINKAVMPGDMFALAGENEQGVIKGDITFDEYDQRMSVTDRASNKADRKALQEGTEVLKENMKLYKDASRSIAEVKNNSKTYSAEYAIIQANEAESSMMLDIQREQERLNNLLKEAELQGNLEAYKQEVAKTAAELSAKYGERLTSATVDKIFEDADLEYKRKLNEQGNSISDIKAEEMNRQYEFNKGLLVSDLKEKNNSYAAKKEIRQDKNDLALGIQALEQENDRAVAEFNKQVNDIEQDNDRPNPKTGEIEGRQNDAKRIEEATKQMQQNIDEINRSMYEKIAQAEADYDKVQAEEKARREKFEIEQRAGGGNEATEKDRRRKWEENHKDDKSELKEKINGYREDAETAIEKEQDKLYGNRRTGEKKNGVGQHELGIIPKIEIEAVERKARAAAEIADLEARERVRIQSASDRLASFKEYGGTVKLADGTTLNALGESAIARKEDNEKLRAEKYLADRETTELQGDQLSQLNAKRNKQDIKSIKKDTEMEAQNIYVRAGLNADDEKVARIEQNRELDKQAATATLNKEQSLSDVDNFIRIQQLKGNLNLEGMDLQLGKLARENDLKVHEAHAGDQISIKRGEDGKLEITTNASSGLLSGIELQQDANKDMLGSLSSPTAFSSEGITFNTNTNGMNLAGMKNFLADKGGKNGR